MQSGREREAMSFVSGLVLGAAIGAGVALLTTPQPGRRTRRRIRKTARRIGSTASDRIDELASDLKGKVDEMVSATRDRLPG